MYLVSLFQLTCIASDFRMHSALCPGRIKAEQQQKPKHQRVTGRGGGVGKRENCTET